MKVVVFAGPTLSAHDGQALLPGATFSGPAACGDVARAARDRFDAIAIIDGYFHQRLSVWHKEILWALSRGVRVYGAASMGALRAAELSDFGMVGVGLVFEWFRDGVLEDDDEVAIVHDTAQRGYVARSDAMVNVRSTLARAQEAGVVSRGTAEQLNALGKSIFFAQRSFPALLAAAEAHAVASAELAALATWLRDPRNPVDQKRSDAIALLRRIEQDVIETRAPEPPGFVFQYTEAWHELMRRL
jgi:hypothetical protein